MGYVRSIAHHTASAARHAGDTVWIRGGNGQAFSPLDTVDLGDATPGFDWSNLVTGLVKSGAEVYGSIASGQANKDAANTAAKSAAASAAAQAAMAKQDADAQLQLQKLKSSTTTSVLKSVLPWTLGGVFALAVVGMGVHFALNRKRR